LLSESKLSEVVGGSIQTRTQDGQRCTIS
jgi:hypothetical protein